MAITASAALRVWEEVICNQYHDDDRQTDPTCGDCHWCCWAFDVEIANGAIKAAASTCPHLIAHGCAIHDTNDYPVACSRFECVYLKRERGEKARDSFGRELNARFHRPGLFAEELIHIKGTVMPAIPNHIPLPLARELIKQTSCLPEYNGIWHLQMLP